MSYTVEVLLRDSDTVVSTNIDDADRPPAAWTDDDVRQVLESMLQAIAQAKDPQGDPNRAVVLRGLSWIVDSVGGGVMIAIEIPMGAVVAGPFPIEQRTLDAMVGRVIAGVAPTRLNVH